MDVREKMVELLDEAEEWANHKCDELDCETCQARKMRGNCFQQLMVGRLITNGVTVQEWIPASEPPKKITNKVIVLCKNGYMGYGHYEDYKGKQTWYNLESGKPFTDWDLEDCESYEVTHWMPMPQPPKGE